MAARRGISEELSRSYRNFLQPIMVGIVGGALFSIALERTIRLFYEPLPLTHPETLTIIALWCCSLILFFPVCWYYAKKVSMLIETFSFEIEPTSGLSIIEPCILELKGTLEEPTAIPTGLKHTIERVRSALTNIDGLLRTGDMKKMWDQNKVQERKKGLQLLLRELNEAGFKNERVISSLQQLIRWFNQLINLDKIFLDAFERTLCARLKNFSSTITIRKETNRVEIRKKTFRIFNLLSCVVYFDLQTSFDFETPVECTAIYYSIEAPLEHINFRSCVRNSLNDAILSEEFSPLYLKLIPSVFDLLYRISDQLMRSEE